MKLTQVEVSGLRGRDLAIDLEDLTVVQGPNGAGKTTVAEAVLLSLTGRLPGRDADKAGLCSVGPLLDLTAGAPWTVAVHDDGGHACGFAFRPADAGGTRQVLPPAHGAPGTPGDNAGARAAIAQRYGGALGVTLLDLEGLRRMEPVELERAVLALCASASSVSVDGIAADLAGTTLDDVKPETRELLDLTEDALLERLELPAEPANVLEAVEQLGRLVGANRSIANGEVRATRAAVDAPIPQGPTKEELDALTRAAAVAADRAARAAEALGAARQRADGARGQARAWEEQRAEREAMAKRSLDRAESTEKNATGAETTTMQAIVDAQRKIADLDEELRRAAERSGHAASEDELRAAREARARAWEAVAEANAAAQAKAKAAREAERVLSTAQAVHGSAQQRLEDEDRRMDELESGPGTCPTCGQDLPMGDVGALTIAGEQREAARKLAADAKWSMEEASVAAVTALDAEVEATSLERAARNRANEADRVLAELDARATSTLDADRARLTERRRNQEERLEGAKRQLAAHRATQETATREVEELRAAWHRVRMEVCPHDPSAEARSMSDAEGAAKVAAVEAREAQRAREDAAKAAHARDEATSRRARAQQERATAQAWHDVWRTAEAALPGVQARATAGLLSPFTGPVQRMAATFAPQLGVFDVASGARPRVGWRRGDVVVPLGALSAGEASLTLLMLAAALHHLASSPLRLVVVDGVEVLDEGNQAAFARLAERLVRAGRLDQVLVCGLPGGRWDGWSVVTMAPPAALEEAA